MQWSLVGSRSTFETKTSVAHGLNVVGMHKVGGPCLASDHGPVTPTSANRTPRWS